MYNVLSLIDRLQKAHELLRVVDESEDPKIILVASCKIEDEFGSIRVVEIALIVLVYGRSLVRVRSRTSHTIEDVLFGGPNAAQQGVDRWDSYLADAEALRVDGKVSFTTHEQSTFFPRPLLADGY